MTENNIEIEECANLKSMLDEELNLLTILDNVIYSSHNKSKNWNSLLRHIKETRANVAKDVKNMHDKLETLKEGKHTGALGKAEELKDSDILTLPAPSQFVEILKGIWEEYPDARFEIFKATYDSGEHNLKVKVIR